ncbi:putative nuclear receptor-binding protein [Ixodes scapularis]
MEKYGEVLKDFRSNSMLVNDCVFTMMHHVAGDLKRPEALFHPSILSCFVNILNEGAEIPELYEDLVGYVMNRYLKLAGRNPELYAERMPVVHKGAPASSTQPLVVPPFYYDETSDSDSDLDEGDDNALYWCFLQFEYDSDPVGQIVEHLKRNDVRRTRREFLLNSSKVKDHAESQEVVNEEISEITDLVLKLKGLGFESQLQWIQKKFLEVCYVKLISMVTPAADIYSFGMCALEMAALEIPGNGDSGTQITEDVVNKTIESLENVHQKDFIRKCLRKSPQERPTARELLFHPVIFEVHALQVLAAHVIVKSASYHPDQLTDEAVVSRYSQADVIAEISHRDGRDGVALRKNEVPKLELEKLLEDVRNGIYPLTAFVMSHQPIVRPRASSPEVSESVQSASPEPFDAETRRIINMMCNIKQQEESQNFVMTLLLRMDDKMNRQLTCELSLKDTPSVLVTELVHYGFINKDDRNMVEVLIQDTLSRSHIPGIPNPGAPLSVGAA